jgi:hypothetical protein
MGGAVLQSHGVARGELARRGRRIFNSHSELRAVRLSCVTLAKLLSSEWSRDVVRGLYYALPKVFDLGTMLTKIVQEKPIDSWMPVWSTAIFGVVCLAAGLYTFQKKNY